MQFYLTNQPQQSNNASAPSQEPQQQGDTFKPLDSLIQETEDETAAKQQEEKIAEETEKPEIIYHAHGGEGIKPIDVKVPRFRPETSDKKRKKAPKARVELPD